MDTPSEAVVINQVFRFVVEQIELGHDKFSITEKLESMGVDRAEASVLVESVFNDAKQAAFDERPKLRDVIKGAVGGVLAAVLGGSIWAALATLADMEVAFVAWIIGALCGFAVLQMANGTRGKSVQWVAVACSLFAVLLGKYGTFFFSLRQLFVEELGAASVTDMSMFSTAIVGIYLESIPSMINPWLALWIFLAVFTAWLIPKSYFPEDSPLNYKTSSI